MTVRVDGSLDGIDWARAKADLAADDFDNGRSPQALRVSFERPQPAFMSAVVGEWLANQANPP